MAPRKRTSDEAAAAVAVTTRVTRSSNRRPETPAPAAAAAVKPEPKKRNNKKAKTVSAQIDEVEVSKVVDEVADAGEKARTIVIEYCKQCNAFKTRAFQVKAGLESGVPGITVILNPEKPRRGCFEIREEGGEKFITLLDMPRPFKKMKELDMDKVISDIIDKIK